MSEQKPVASLDEVLQSDGTHYTTVEAYGKTIRLGSLSSSDMLEWLEENDHPDKKKAAGLRILVKSIVDADGKRYEESKREDIVKVFASKDNKENSIVIAKVLELNGLTRPKELLDAIKNGSSEAATDASPTVSQ